jgi:hypothetical protein
MLTVLAARPRAWKSIGPRTKTVSGIRIADPGERTSARPPGDQDDGKDAG